MDRALSLLPALAAARGLANGADELVEPLWCCGGFASPLPNQGRFSWQQLRFMLQLKAAAEDLGTLTIAAMHWA